MKAPRRGGRRAFARAGLTALVAELAFALVLASTGASFDPGQVASTAGDSAAFNVSIASEFRLKLESLTACAWKDCNVTQSDAVKVTIDGPDRLTGTFAEQYRVLVEGVDGFSENYTTIAVVLNGSTSDVTIQPDASAERTGSMAYTKNLNGSRTMNLTLLPANRTSNVTMYVFGYVGEGNRSAHGAREFFQVAKKDIEMRAQRVLPVNVSVANDANVSVRDVTVAFFAKGPADASFAPIGNASLTSIDAKGKAEAGVTWDVTWEDPAVYTVKVVIDPLHLHGDAFEDNNVHFFEVNLGPAAPASGLGSAMQVFFWGTLAVIVGVAVGLWWYNRFYE